MNQIRRAFVKRDLEIEATALGRYCCKSLQLTSRYRRSSTRSAHHVHFWWPSYGFAPARINKALTSALRATVNAVMP
jgi:hypothetical protein